MNKCVFLDRDGVLNQDLDGYLFEPERIEIPDGVCRGLAKLKEAGYLLVVITNQAGIAKGLYTPDDVWGIHHHLNQAYQGVLDDLYFAPHHEDYTTRSLSRKPGSLLIERAIAKHNVDVTKSWMVGDSERDIVAGKKAGVRTILLKKELPETSADYGVSNFQEVADKILSAENQAF